MSAPERCPACDAARTALDHGITADGDARHFECGAVWLARSGWRVACLPGWHAAARMRAALTKTREWFAFIANARQFFYTVPAGRFKRLNADLKAYSGPLASVFGTADDAVREIDAALSPQEPAHDH